MTTLFLITHCLTYCSVFKIMSESAEPNVVIPKGTREKLEEAG